MSEYTYVNIFTQYPQSVRSNLLLGGYERVVENDGLDLVFVRLGGDERAEVRQELLGEKNGSLIYATPVSGRLESGDFVAYVLIDRMEDTGNSHRTKLYEVDAFESATKIDEHVVEDGSINAEDIERYYSERYEFSPCLTF